MQKLQAWPNGLGYTYGSWDLVKENGRWTAVNKPAWFGAATEVGHGDSWTQAIATAQPTDEYTQYLEHQAEKAAA